MPTLAPSRCFHPWPDIPPALQDQAPTWSMWRFPVLVLPWFWPSKLHLSSRGFVLTFVLICVQFLSPRFGTQIGCLLLVSQVFGGLQLEGLWDHTITPVPPPSTVQVDHGSNVQEPPRRRHHSKLEDDPNCEISHVWINIHRRSKKRVRLK